MTLKTPLLARLGSASRGSSSSGRSSSRGSTRRVVMEADLSFAARLKHNPHMHREALIRSNAQRLVMKLSTYGPVPDVAISTCGSLMLLGSYTVTLVHVISGGLVTLLDGADLAAKRGAELAVAKREELLLGKCCCFSDDSSMCAAASGAAVVVFDVLSHASPQARPTCTELCTVTLGGDATQCVLGPSGAGGVRYALACDATGACYFWQVAGAGGVGTAGMVAPPAARKVAARTAEVLQTSPPRALKA